MAFGVQPVDFNYFLARKYALQQQEADATTSNAASTRIQADANAGVAATQAKMNTVQTGLLPGESASQNALRAAQAGLMREQAAVVRPEADAGIALTRANAQLANINGLAVRRTALTDTATGGGLAIGGLPGMPAIRGSGIGRALGGVLGSTASRFSLSGPLPGRMRGESEAAYLDRINGL